MAWTHPRQQRPARMQWGVLAFLVAFTAGLILLSYYYLFPALQAFVQAKEQGDKPGTKAISATSALLLAVLLVILVTGLILTFRLGRLFFPRSPARAAPTHYVDAWAESAKRMETPPPENE